VAIEVHLLLVRHAIAEERGAAWPDDDQRPLSHDGARKWKRAARGLARVVPSVDLLLTSPLTRTFQTAEILARAGVSGSYVLLKATTASKLSGTLWPLALRGEADVEVKDFKVLSKAWDHWRPGEFIAVEAARGRVVTSVSITPEAVRMPDARVTVGTQTLIADANLELSKARGA
jgi:broad specificity phosphatase PhoE